MRIQKLSLSVISGTFLKKSKHFNYTSSLLTDFPSSLRYIRSFDAQDLIIQIKKYTPIAWVSMANQVNFLNKLNFPCLKSLPGFIVKFRQKNYQVSFYRNIGSQIVG